MRWSISLLVLSLAAFCLVVIIHQPVSENDFNVMDQIRRNAERRVNDGSFTIVHDHIPLIMMERPFDGLVSKALLALNLPSTLLVVLEEFLLKETGLRSRAISYLTGTTFLVAITLQWLAIGRFARARQSMRKTAALRKGLS